MPTINIRGTTTVLVLYEHYVTAKSSPHYWQSVSSVGVRFIVPAYMNVPTKWRTEMCVWWCGNVYLIMWKYVINNVEMRVWWNENTYLMTWIYVFDNVRIRARWIDPYAWRGVRCAFHGLFVGILRNVHHVIANRSSRISCVFVAHSLVEYDVFVKIKNLEKNLTYQFFCLPLQYIRISLLRLLAVQ